MSPEKVGELVNNIRDGRIGVMPTDTVYGIVGSVRFPETIEHIYQAKGRDFNKPFIVLISDKAQLDDLGIYLDSMQKEILQDLWPGSNSIVLPCYNDMLSYLHRETNSLAVRLPEPQWLIELINQTGPIVATSANISDEETSDDIEIIKEQLPDLDFYYEGDTTDEPSSLYRITDVGRLEQIR